jgi:hypothetical protein
MKRLFLLFALFLSGLITWAQNDQRLPAYGYEMDRFRAVKSMQIPYWTTGDPRVDRKDSLLPQIGFKINDPGSIWVFDPATGLWTRNGSGVGSQDWISDWRTTAPHLSQSLELTYKPQSREVFTLPTPLQQIHGFVYAKGMLFATPLWQTNFIKRKVVRFNDPNDFTNYDSVVWRNGFSDAPGVVDGGLSLHYAKASGKLYTGLQKDSSTANTTAHIFVAEIDPVTLDTATVWIDAYDYDTEYPAVQAITSDADYLYVLAGESGTYRIIKIPFSDPSAATEETYSGMFHGHAMVHDGDHLYVTEHQLAAGSKAAIWKILPSDLSVVDTAQTQTGDYLIPDDIEAIGDYVYASMETASGYILRFRKSDLSITRIYTGSASASYGLFYDGRFLWNMHNSSPGILTRYNPETGEIYKHTLETGENAPNEMQSDGQRYFIPTWGVSNTELIRLSSPLMTYVSGGASSGGTVSSFSSGNLSPLFTTSVATATSTPALSFTLSNAAPFSFFGRASGTGVPSFIVGMDSNWIADLHSENYYNTKYFRLADTASKTWDWNDVTGKPSLFANPMTTLGDIIYQFDGVPTRLPIGTESQVLTVSAGGVPEWATPTGGGASDHGALTGLSDDDHLQYHLGAGRSGGQTVTGGTDAADVLKYKPTSGNSPSNSTLVHEFLGGNNGATSFGGFRGDGIFRLDANYLYMPGGSGFELFLNSNQTFFQCNGGPLIFRSNSAYSARMDNGKVLLGGWSGAAHSDAQIEGSFAPTVTSTATGITLNDENHEVLVTATGQTITLPTAASITGREYFIKLTASGTCTIATTSSQTIDGSTSVILNGQNRWIRVASNGSNWYIKSQDNRPLQSRQTIAVGNSTNTLDPSGIGSTVEAGATYRFEAVIFATNGSQGGQYAISGSATATSIRYHIQGVDNSTNAINFASEHTALASADGITGAWDGMVKIVGTITVNAGGTLEVYHANQGGGAGTATVATGSYLVLTKF